MLHFFAILAAFMLLRSVLRQLDRIEAASAPSQSALDQKVLCGYTPATPDEYVAALERHNRAATACLPHALTAPLPEPLPERPPFSAHDARVCVVLGVLFVGLLMVCSYAGHGYFWPINLR